MTQRMIARRGNFPVLFFLRTVYNAPASDIRIIEGMGYFMHTYMKALMVLSLLVLNVGTLQAQTQPWPMGVDSSLRLELLVGSQSLRESSPTGDQLDRFRFLSNPSMPVLSGTVELSPMPWASGRLAGGLSILEPTRELSTSVGVASADGTWAGRWNVRPHYAAWEAAGLFHLCNMGGYRFSAVAGYRGKTWKYYGEDTSRSSERDAFTSNIPFLGLQTSMYFPLWKARFEVLGSPFMNTVVRNTLNASATNSSVFHLKTDRGGMIEFQMEGTMSLSPSILCGLSARLSYEELFGPLDWTNSAGNPPGSQTGFDAHLVETLAFFGLNVSLLF
jgi:hypothetical protein